MKLVLDVESTIYEQGHPFAASNKLCCVGLYDGRHYDYYDIEHSGNPYNEALEEIKRRVQQADLIIGANLKFDIHWLKRYIPDLRIANVHDIQLTEYILSAQTWVMPSLGDMAIQYQVGTKSDYISKTYWERGVDTTHIPHLELAEYNASDCRLSFDVYLKQLERITPELRSLIQLHHDDLLVLEEMEFNGMRFDATEAEVKAKETKKEYQELAAQLNTYDPDAILNWNSGDHVSAILYGGTIKLPVRETVTKHYKYGDKDVERWGTKEVVFPRLVTPLEGTERKKDGFYEVNEDVLRSLKADAKTRRLIDTLLKLSELEKLEGTYYTGIPKRMEKMQWQDGKLHGQFNQCVTRTGRSSSSGPNLQNFDARLKELFRSEFK